jgi:glucose-6-phosphate 1-epimerase
VELSIKNTGQESFSFTTALHSYFKISDIKKIAIKGLENCSYNDSTISQNNSFTQPDSPLIFNGEIDRIYSNISQKIRLEDQADIMSIESTGFQDVVVWNPWEEKCKKLKDMLPYGYKKMVCIESGKILSPLVLHPDKTWSGSQKLVIENK